MTSSSVSNLKSYRGYAGLPALAGLSTMQQATTAGLTIGEGVDRLKRLHWAMRRLHGIFIGHIVSMPVYELKMAFSLHAHYCAEHADTFAKRVREMRQPPYGLESSPDPMLDVFFDEILCAPDTASLVFGLYEAAMPAILEAVQAFLGQTNRLFDHPTVRVLRFAQIEFEEVVSYGREAVKALVNDGDRDRLKPWSELLRATLASAGGLDGTQAHSGESIARQFSANGFVFDGVPRRDERFQDPYNMGVNAEAMLFDETIPAQPKTLMLYFKRMREIDVPEVMASILWETRDKPWEYYRAMTRQLWDEARHAMMGELGFVSLGIDWRQIPFNFTWSRGLNTMLTPLERHGVLYSIEQGLMPKKTGKEREWEIAVASASRLSELIQDYDWADEIVHAKVGRDWLVPELGSQQAALAFGDKAWTKTLVDWAKWRDDGLTEHRNWWPEVYRAACRQWGTTPDPAVLAYSTTYETLRADMKQVNS
jgi:hypothetical protein